MLCYILRRNTYKLLVTKADHLCIVTKLFCSCCYNIRTMGIDGKVSRWIKAFLDDRTQKVCVDGYLSGSSTVKSGVPQGTVLDPLLFLCFINDLPSVLDPDTQVRLFADDCLTYRVIESIEDQLQFQKDLSDLSSWAINGACTLT